MPDEIDAEHLGYLALMPIGRGKYPDEAVQRRCLAIESDVREATCPVGADEMNDDLNLTFLRPVHRRKQIEVAEARGDERGHTGDPLREQCTRRSLRHRHPAPANSARASTNAAGRGGHPGTYHCTGITSSTPGVTA